MNCVNLYSNLCANSKYNCSNGCRAINSNAIVMPHDDVFYSCINKPFNLSKARETRDIPRDANIFLFTPQTYVQLPTGRNAKECIITDKGFPLWNKLFGSEDDNSMILAGNEVEWAHGDLTRSGITCGTIELINAKVNQIEDISMLRIKKNSVANYISDVSELWASDSTMGQIKKTGAVHLNGKTDTDSIEAYSIVANAGDKINKIKSMSLICKENLNDANRFTEIEDADVEEAAEITQTKIKNLKTSELSFNNSIGGTVTANTCSSFNNSVVDELTLGRVKSMSGCKINKFNIKTALTTLKLYDKVQINELNLDDSDAKLFVFPKSEWGKATDNYIKRINVKNYQYAPNRPSVKIQGDIDVDEVVFHEGPGMVELTKAPNPNKPIKVINGFIKYNVAPDPIPTHDELEV